MSRTTTTTMLAAAGSLALGLALGCTHPSHVKEEWGKSYHENVEAMAADPAAELENASEPGAPDELAALAADPGVAEAVGRLSQWDFSTPTGILEGYDAHDKKGKRTPSVPKKEAEASVAATIYNLWRAKAIDATIDLDSLHEYRESFPVLDDGRPELEPLLP